MLDSGDLLVRLLILLLGVTTRGLVRCPLFDPESSELSELIYPDDDLDNPETAESDFIKPLLPVSCTRCVHSSPQPRTLGFCAIGSSGVIGRPGEDISDIGGVLGRGFCFMLSVWLMGFCCSASCPLSWSKDEARDTLRSKQSSPKELTRHEILRAMWKASGDWKGFWQASSAVRMIPVARLQFSVSFTPRNGDGNVQCQARHHHIHDLGPAISPSRFTDFLSRRRNTRGNQSNNPQQQRQPRNNKATRMQPQLRRPRNPHRFIVTRCDSMKHHIRYRKS